MRSKYKIIRPYMKKILWISIGLLLLSAGCQKIVLKKEIPSSPKESYEELPR